MGDPSTNVTQNKAPDKAHTMSGILKFLVFSIVGIIFFFVPVINGEAPLLVVLNVVKSALVNVLPVLAMLVPIFLLVATPFVKKSKFLSKYMAKDSLLSKILYVLGSIFGIMIYFKIGPEFLLNADTGFLALDLTGSVLATILLAGCFVTLIACYGVLEFIGTLIEPIMRPLYRLPGYAAMDIATSISCSAAVDVFMANKIYLNGLYTKRDVSAIVSNFTVCSLGFFLLLCEWGGIPEYYGLTVITSFIICFIISIITVRIPPLSRIPNEYVDGTPYVPNKEKTDGRNILVRAWDSGVSAAEKASPKLLIEGVVEASFFAVKTAAYVISIATIALVVAMYTPVFQWIGIPIAPLLQLLQIPDAAAIAPSVLVGITEIAMPVLLIAGQNVAPAATFFIVVLSTVQVIFFTESANAIMESDIPLGAGQLVVTFLLRTAIAIPLCALAMHLLL